MAGAIRLNTRLYRLGKCRSVKTTQSTPFGDVAQAFAKSIGACPDQCRFVFAGRMLFSDDTRSVSTLGIRDRSTVHLQFRLRGGKPVIYLFPPSHTTLTAKVTLTLSHQWSFSALYPIVATKRVLMADGRQGECVQWDFDVKANGELVDLNSNAEVSYAFWEAQ
ncbi:hypothetical protein DL93DRAFT_981097 [Clavulina sp. PMI_390]|nr:hypothetical protein DL93DRAFT_981097 [Clavulina sp. PMI_390]